MVGRRQVIIGGDAKAVVLRIIKGSDRRFAVRWLDADRQPVAIASVDGVVKGDEEQTLVADIGVHATLEDGGTLVRVAIPGSVTAGLVETDHGTWNLTVTGVSGEIKTLIQGSVVVKSGS